MISQVPFNASTFLRQEQYLKFYIFTCLLSYKFNKNTFNLS
jgi:hypothetical protein